ncbi:SCP2 sterol-binding domain-containing protein [Pseudonocardia sp. MH-G8]|uniref:SCP2 sterol-binding domain-containing protein n=1 Tax=Pseudonocardia sp. MH-G8 TaxID=1854588 RepID=UPI000BA0C9BB|nr:SCP2 sterol-binding domain-containing protein [Pseudonocardia sp. MH-G8]OZM83075.1 hypothetical protein CFP66_00380 [Pseudonocardia sp. MH-G8]
MEYLSEEFFAEFSRRGRKLAEQPGLSLVVQYLITEVPDGRADVHYYFDVRDGRIEHAVLGDAPQPDISIATTFADNLRILVGELAASEAFMSGRLRPSGNMAKLTAMMPLVQSTGYQQLVATMRGLCAIPA